MSYKRILVPIDGSATSRLGLKEALKLARERRAKLHLVHVVDAHVLAYTPEAGVALPDILPALTQSGKRLLERAKAAAARSGVACTTALLETFAGPAADSIVREARRSRADLIVIGTHGRRGVRRLVLGSDAEQVVRSSPVPVLLVRARGKG